jgi:hypothetical protein
MGLLDSDAELEAVVDFDKIESRRTWGKLTAEEFRKIKMTNKHVGQYKLFLSDLLAIAMAQSYMPDKARDIVVVVAGASPGQHWTLLIPLLLKSNIGGRVRFELYDNAELCDDMKELIKGKRHVVFHNQLFTNETAGEIAKKYVNEYVVFFSDIRSSIHERKTHDANDEELIKTDMLAQQEDVVIMSPVYSCLKFHAPHATHGHEMVYPPFRYLSGILCLQAYTYDLSAEFRLHITQADIHNKGKWYDPLKMEEYAFYHNTIRRPTTHTDKRFENAVWKASAAALGINAYEASVSRKRITTFLHMQNILNHQSERNNPFVETKDQHVNLRMLLARILEIQ